MILTVSNVLAGALGYVYQVVMGRLLTPTEYALFCAVLSATMLFGSPLSAWNMLIVRRLSLLLGAEKVAGVRSFFWKNLRYICISGLVLLIVTGLNAPAIRNYLKSPGDDPVWLLALIVIVAGLMVLNTAFLQSFKLFKTLAILSLFSVIVRLIFSGALIFAGFAVAGALFGFVIAGVFVWLMGLSRVFPSMRALDSHQNCPTREKDFSAHNIFAVLLANVCFVTMTQSDMVLVNYFFSSEEAGLYAAASVLGKAVLYLPGGLVFALFPLVAEQCSRGEEVSKLLKQALFFTLVLCGAVALIYFFLGVEIIRLLYGSNYEGAGFLLRWFGFAILPMALVLVCEHFLIAQGRVVFAWLFLIIAPMQVCTIYLFHSELWMILLANSGFGLVLAVSGFIVAFRKQLRFKLF